MVINVTGKSIRTVNVVLYFANDCNLHRCVDLPKWGQSNSHIWPEISPDFYPTPGYSQVTARIRPIYLHCGSREVDLLCVDFKSLKSNLHGKTHFIHYYKPF